MKLSSAILWCVWNPFWLYEILQFQIVDAVLIAKQCETQNFQIHASTHAWSVVHEMDWNGTSVCSNMWMVEPTCVSVWSLNSKKTYLCCNWLNCFAVNDSNIVTHCNWLRGEPVGTVRFASSLSTFHHTNNAFWCCHWLYLWEFVWPSRLLDDTATQRNQK